MKKHVILGAIIGLSLLGSMPHSPVQAAAVTTSSIPVITTNQLTTTPPTPRVNPYVGLTTTNEAIVYTTQSSATSETSDRTKVN
ncbi:hypothetical protein AB0Y04_11570 [Loigolactobacillus coryniformis]|jgi:hypothetical protein|uniref:hypothetical protein n=2 Tax=Lactobacillaceae TaxID=33958 RepID=UPI00201A488D|nr:hypothetical protein [Loigolactobacillus coryniformis]MCL5459339.1 hypothetical protein [Loigolactobacillus coryniformis]